MTWEWIGDHAKPERKVAEVLNPRMSPERVREIVELVYHRDSSLAEKMRWRLCKQIQPYPAEFQTIDGVPWKGQVVCGHNPSLLARLVDDLKVDFGAEGTEQASWTERCTVREMTDKMRLMRR